MNPKDAAEALRIRILVPPAIPSDGGPTFLSDYPAIEPSAAYQSGASAMRRVRHKKRGSTYKVIGYATLQTSEPIGDDADLIIYQDEKGGWFWVRPTFEFNDGRFEDLPADPASSEGADWEARAKAFLESLPIIISFARGKNVHRPPWPAELGGFLRDAFAARDAEIATLRGAFAEQIEAARSAKQDYDNLFSETQEEVGRLRAALEKEQLINECHCTNVEALTKERDAAEAALDIANAKVAEADANYPTLWGKTRAYIDKLESSLEKSGTALKAYETLEADLVLNGDWSGSGVAMSQAQHDKMMECQALRNEAFAALGSVLCSDCPRVGYSTDDTRCIECPRRPAIKQAPGK